MNGGELLPACGFFPPVSTDLTVLLKEQLIFFLCYFYITFFGVNFILLFYFYKCTEHCATINFENKIILYTFSYRLFGRLKNKMNSLDL